MESAFIRRGRGKNRNLPPTLREWELRNGQRHQLALADFGVSELAAGAHHVAALGAAAFGGAIPSLPGAVGTFDGAIVGALTLLSGDQSTALAAALTARFYNDLNSGVIGGIGLMREGQTLTGVYQQIKDFRKKKEE